MKERKYIFLKVILILLALLCDALGFLLIFIGQRDLNIPLVLSGMLPIMIASTICVYSFFILDPTNKIDLRTCPSGTRVKIFKTFFLKLRKFNYDFMVMYYPKQSLSPEFRFLPVSNDLKRLAIADGGLFYRIFEFKDIIARELEENIDDGYCHQMKVILKLNDDQMKEVELHLINKKVKLGSSTYVQQKRTVDQLFASLPRTRI